MDKKKTNKKTGRRSFGTIKISIKLCLARTRSNTACTILRGIPLSHKATFIFFN